MSLLTDTTVVMLSGDALQFIARPCQSPGRYSRRW